MEDRKPQGEGEGEKKAGVSFARTAIWVGVGGIALYLIGSGVVGLIVNGP